MRSSGETTAPQDVGEEDARDGEQTAGTVGSHSAESPSLTPMPPVPNWLKIEPSKRRLASTPDRLSRAAWTQLSRQVATFLRSRHNVATLRLAVRRVVAEMRVAGASPKDVEGALRRAVLEHPELVSLDRTNILTRRLASEELLDRIVDVAREIGPSGGDSGE